MQQPKTKTKQFAYKRQHTVLSHFTSTSTPNNSIMSVTNILIMGNSFKA